VTASGQRTLMRDRIAGEFSPRTFNAIYWLLLRPVYWKAVRGKSRRHALKIAAVHGDLESHLMDGSLSSTGSTSQYRTTSIGSAVIARFTVVTACNNRPHLPSAAMRPKTMTNLRKYPIAYFTMGDPSPSKLPLFVGDLDPNPNLIGAL